MDQLCHAPGNGSSGHNSTSIQNQARGGYQTSVPSSGRSHSVVDCEVLVRTNKQSLHTNVGVRVNENDLDISTGEQDIKFVSETDETDDPMHLKHLMEPSNTFSEPNQFVELRRTLTVVISAEHAEPMRARHAHRNCDDVHCWSWCKCSDERLPELGREL